MDFQLKPVPAVPGQAECQYFFICCEADWKRHCGTASAQGVETGTLSPLQSIVSFGRTETNVKYSGVQPQRLLKRLL